MNNPEEKAQDLYNLFFDCDEDLPQRGQGFMSVKLAKACSLICIDEIIATGLLAKGENVQPWNLIYWQKVKEEIQKL